MHKSIVVATILGSLTFSLAKGQEYSVEVVEQPPAADEVAAELTQQLADKGYRVQRGSNRTVCQIWLCKQWEVDADFKASDERLYPFRPGQLIGLLHFKRKGSDFRDQQLGSGWYTLRMGLQPIDGNHEGTSPTRDFLLLVNVADDAPEKEWDPEELHKASALAADSSHPAMLCLQAPLEDPQPTIRHDEQNDWWILHLVGKSVAGEKTSDLFLDVVVAGQAAE